MTLKPKPHGILGYTKLYAKGICMGSADIVPGISGGTVAFIMGFYYDLLASLCTLSRKNFSLFLKGDLRLFFKEVAWEFLLTLILGMVTAFITLASLFHYILNDPTWRVMLYSAFFGLILSSGVFCARQVKHWNALTFFLLAFGTTLGALTFWVTPHQTAQHTPYGTLDPWIIFSGSMAVCALLLPGISGSYVLNICGVYGPAISSLHSFSEGIRLGYFEGAAFALLANLAVGILLGGLVFSQGIKWLLTHYSDSAIAFLTGFMLGAIHSVWPFWQQHQPYFPSMTHTLLLPACACCLVGGASIFILEQLRKQLYRNKSTDQALDKISVIL